MSVRRIRNVAAYLSKTAQAEASILARKERLLGLQSTDKTTPEMGPISTGRRAEDSKRLLGSGRSRGGAHLGEAR